MLNIVSDLRGKYNSRLYLYLIYPEINHASFKKHKWVEFYGNVKGEIPPNMPEPRGKDVDLRMYVDRNHSGDKSTSISRIRFLIYMIMDLIYWISKKQPTIEMSVFGAEFVAMKHGIETLRGLRYKLMIMGVLIFQDFIHLWVKYVSYLQYPESGVYYEKKRSN